MKWKAAMLESISWTKFLEAAAVASACYYTGLALTSYRKEILAFMNNPGSIRIGKKANSDERKQPAAPMAIIHDLSTVFGQAGYQADRAQLLDNIKAVLRKYKNAELPRYRVPVQDYIISKAEEICGVRITMEELEFVE